MQEPKPLDPKQSFVAVSITREEIATELTMLGDIWSKIEPTDPRLTDEFCTAFAKEFGEQTVDDEARFGSDDWLDFIETTLDKLFS